MLQNLNVSPFFGIAKSNLPSKESTSLEDKSQCVGSQVSKITDILMTDSFSNLEPLSSIDRAFECALDKLLGKNVALSQLY